MNKWEQRIRRAGELASAYPVASEGLHFYELVARFQQSLYGAVERESGGGNVRCGAGSLRQELDLFVLLPRLAPFVTLIEEIAPQPLSDSARKLNAAGVERWRNMLDDFWFSESKRNFTTPEQLISWLFLQPYAEYLADHSEKVPTNGTPELCPQCRCKPSVGVLRQEGDGAKRSLICMLCSTEWPYRRIGCAACGEESPDKLAVYIAEAFDHIRIEACETCRRYITTIDLTKNGKAVPVVDELAAIPLSLWAEENRYSKLTVNLLGI